MNGTEREERNCTNNQACPGSKNTQIAQNAGEMLCMAYIYNARAYIICINYIVVDCEWGDWVEGDCSATCGAGQQNNTRTKLVEEAHGGNCTGESTNVTSCVVVQCLGM